MESEQFSFKGYSIRYISVNTLIVGSGAASLNAASGLHSMGQKDIVVATSKWGGGTSNNAGSDKQTYYKLSLCGREPDSVIGMARDLFNGRCMHGDIALCEAQGSVRAFMKLADLGVPFPRDKYGSWVGYKTDNDPRARATSAGPGTSRYMFEVLAGEVKRRKIKILDNHQVIELLTDNARKKVTGAIAIDLKQKDPRNAFVLFNAVNIVLGTGGPGDIYSESVYPLSQTGSIGMALRAGASGQNLTESQFGIASLKFRWNLSGSYQQVMPRYFSTTPDGQEEREFLNDYFPGYAELTKAVFLKGYQWPFDPSRIEGNGSSVVDLLVYRERNERGRRVFLDFRRNISWNGREDFLPERLDSESRTYLSNSGSLQETPVGRLISMNRPAYELYRDHGIDLAREPVEIGICAQHNNGGLKGNIWWESDLKHLFPVGEVNGSHGVSRPGGSALNSGQVGSWRAAEFISRRYRQDATPKDQFFKKSEVKLSQLLNLAEKWLSSVKKENNRVISEEIKKRMSLAGSVVRNRHRVFEACLEAFSMTRDIRNNLGALTVNDLADCFRISDNCLAHLVYLETMRTYIMNGGRSRGSYIVTGSKENDLPDASFAGLDIHLCRFDRDIERNILVAKYRRGKVILETEEVREIPVQNLWFEKVWKDYMEDNYIAS